MHPSTDQGPKNNPGVPAQGTPGTSSPVAHPASPPPEPSGPALAGVLFDRDGTLVHDVPYNTEPDAVEPVPGARQALERLRSLGLRIGVLTNQSGVGRGLITVAQLAAVNARVEELLGPFDDWFICPHAPDDGCACRKPAPGMVLAAARAWECAPEQLAVVGDIGADVQAAANAGAWGVLVPTPVTSTEEISASAFVAPNLAVAVDLLVGARPVPVSAGAA